MVIIFLDYNDLKKKKFLELINLYKNYNVLKNLVFNADFKIDADGKKEILNSIISSNLKRENISNNFKLIKNSGYFIRKVKIKI